MTRRVTVDHEFVDYIPDQLEEGVVYVCIPYTTVAHNCLCGCGNEVITPLSPTDWQLIFDGRSISLKPSIGNWSFECQSHYWIERSRVRWAPRWTREQIYAGRARDRLAKQGRLAPTSADVPTARTKSPWGLLRKLSRRLWG